VTRFAGTQGYDKEAGERAARYESIAPEIVHGPVLHLIRDGPCRTLEIGAGTGRDAAWLADRGHTVLAVEPTAEMREVGMRLHPSPNIEWVDDGLPDLASLSGREPFDLITLTAMWMHLDRTDRERAMPRLAALAKTGAVMAMLLRHGPVGDGRYVFDTPVEETASLARAAGFALLVNSYRGALRPDGDPGVTWTSLAFRRE
jgi:SAM-dependent methyltransferase